MIFNARAALEELENRQGTPATSATFATQHSLEASNVAKVANVATPRRQERENEPDPPQTQSADFKHGFSICGRPKTWTGKIVSMQEWHQLSTWDKHGPDGRLFNGLTQRWEYPGDAYFRNTRF